MFRWADHVDGAHVDRVRDAFDALPAAIPEIRQYVHGSDVGVAEGNFDYVVVADFDDVTGWRTYRDHPTHVVLIEELIKGHVAERAAVQYQTPADRSPHDVSMAGMQALLAEPDDVDLSGAGDESDDELMERARRAALANMQSLLAEPDDV
jgi:hypothetical protein